jgi:hypothetical protein
MSKATEGANLQDAHKYICTHSIRPAIREPEPEGTQVGSPEPRIHNQIDRWTAGQIVGIPPH